MSKLPLKAYEDAEFLKGDACRAVRLELEFLKPEVTMDRHNIQSTIVLFGSARTLPPEVAAAALAKATEALDRAPGSAERQAAVARARRQVETSHYYQVAREFAALVSRAAQSPEVCDFVIMTGGGPGIMEAGNRGAADVGAKSIGLNISLPFEQSVNPYVSEGLAFQFHYFSIRKMHFLKRTKALCACPGGYGTLDELFEVLTLIQTRKIAPIPIVLFGRSFWERLIHWDLLVEDGLISPGDTELFRFCETAEEAWAFIRAFWAYGQTAAATQPESP
ncbi:MAG: putative lysine decarboxylase [Lentisphaerae bacterium ADurb.BinA184]|nr:MAG: putative lysine decarboxylase [Lentisphaerae bacterium ADurb.BinA184]